MFNTLSHSQRTKLWDHVADLQKQNDRLNTATAMISPADNQKQLYQAHNKEKETKDACLSPFAIDFDGSASRDSSWNDFTQTASKHQKDKAFEKTKLHFFQFFFSILGLTVFRHRFRA